MNKLTYPEFKALIMQSKTFRRNQREKTIKKANIIIWLIAGLLTCVAIGCQLGYKNGYMQGVNRAVACASADGVLLHDGKQYFCWYE